MGVLAVSFVILLKIDSHKPNVTHFRQTSKCDIHDGQDEKKCGYFRKRKGFPLLNECVYVCVNVCPYMERKRDGKKSLEGKFVNGNVIQRREGNLDARMVM